MAAAPTSDGRVVNPGRSTVVEDVLGGMAMGFGMVGREE